MLQYITYLFKDNNKDDYKKDYIEELINIDNDISIDKLIEIYENIIEKIELDDLIKGLLYIRDYKNGKGFRKIGNILLYIIMTDNRKNINIDLMRKYIYTYLNDIGRWDDWNIFFEIDIDKEYEKINKKFKKNEKNKDLIIDIICNELIDNYKKIETKEKIGLCAKWCPSEGKKLDKKIKIVNELSRKLLNMIKKDNKLLYLLDKDILENIIKDNSKYIYRIILSKLRKKMGLIENHLCQKNINEIKIEKIPKMALIYHKKALLNHGINIENINRSENVHKDNHHKDNQYNNIFDFEYIDENSIYIKKNYLDLYNKYI